MSWGPRAKANYRGLKIARRAMLRQARKKQPVPAKGRAAPLSHSPPPTSPPRLPQPPPSRPAASVPPPDRIYTEQDRQAASLWMYVFFWAMLAFFLFCFAGIVAVALGRGSFLDVLKPGAWSLLFAVIVCFRWAKLNRIEKRLMQQADARAFTLRQQKTDDAPAGVTSQPSEVLQSPPASPWKSMTQRDEEWLDQELRWQSDAKRGKSITEEQRQTQMRQQQEKDHQEQEVARRNTEAIRAETIKKQKEEQEKREMELLSAEIKELWSQRKF